MNSAFDIAMPPSAFVWVMTAAIVGLFLGQSSDYGDAQAEGLRYRVIRGHTTSGSGGSAPTPRPLDRSGAAAGFTAEANNTTIASVGTPINLHSDTLYVQAGEKLWLPEGCEWEASQADTLLVVRLMAAPADALLFVPSETPEPGQRPPGSWPGT